MSAEEAIPFLGPETPRESVAGSTQVKCVHESPWVGEGRGIVLFLLTTMEIEPKVLPIPGKHSITELYP